MRATERLSRACGSTGKSTLATALIRKTEFYACRSFEQTEAWLDVYFSGSAPDFTPPLGMNGISPFRRRVWEIMLAIPFGQTSTYGKIARQLAAETGKRVSAQAVGGAVGHNSISLVIPCHRVVGANGSITGYAGGVDRKLQLLKLEGVELSKLSVPRKGTAL